MSKAIDNFESLSEEDSTKYAGKWIAMVDGKVVCIGDSFKQVYTESKINYPKSRPLIGRLPEANPIVLSSI
jgi:hypothetical protein